MNASRLASIGTGVTLRPCARTTKTKTINQGAGSFRNYIELTKPRITWLILMSTGIGYFFALPLGMPLDLGRLWHTVVGTGLLVSGTAVLNQWYERDSDRKMRRTANRPIPSGRVGAGRALTFGIVISVAAFAELAAAVNLLAALLGLLTLASYLFVYTPMKTRSWLSTTIGALPGAMPPMIGFAAASGDISWAAVILSAILFLWQFPHFYSIAWMYREDYARAGILMLPVIEPDCRSTARQMQIYAATLIPVSIVPALVGMSGRLYLAGAVVLGLLYLYPSIRVGAERTASRARGVLIASVVYLPMLYGLMVVDRLS